MANEVYETMTRHEMKSDVLQRNFVVRVWREEPEWKFGPCNEVRKVLQDCEAVLHQLRTSQAVIEIVKVVCELDRISAVEVLDAQGNGGLFYPDWK